MNGQGVPDMNELNDRYEVFNVDGCMPPRGEFHTARVYRVDPTKLGDEFHPLVRVALAELRIRDDHPLFNLCRPYLLEAS